MIIVVCTLNSSLSVCLLMPFDRVWNLRRKKLAQMRKQRCISCLSKHICSLYHYVFISKCILSQGFMLFSNLIQHTEENIYEQVMLVLIHIFFKLICLLMNLQSPIRKANKDDKMKLSLISEQGSEPEGFEPIGKRLRRRHQEERDLVAVDCSEPEDSELLVKRLHQRHQEERALVSVKTSNSQLVITPSKRGYQDINEVSSGSQDWSEPEDSEPQLKRLRPKRALQSRPDAELMQICDEEEVDESTPLKVWIEQTKSKPVSPLQHLKNESRKCNSSTTSPVPKAKGPSQPNLCNNSTESDSLSFQEKGRTSVTPQVAPGERRLTSERGNGIRPFEKLMVEPYLDHTPVENVLDMYQENNFNLPRDEPPTDNHLLDEVPLAIILPGNPISW